MNIFQNDSSAISIPAGHTVFSAGEASGGQMFAVAEGEVDIQSNGETVETIRVGGIFGEMGLIDDQPRSATAVARTSARVVPINERRFTFLVQQNPYFALHVVRTLTERIRRLSRPCGSRG